MPRRKGLLNIESHLEHIQIILDGLKKNGYCPILEEECKIASVINKRLIAIAEEKKAKRREVKKHV